jgi:hypothetical protein
VCECVSVSVKVCVSCSEFHEKHLDFVHITFCRWRTHAAEMAARIPQVPAPLVQWCVTRFYFCHHVHIFLEFCFFAWVSLWMVSVCVVGDDVAAIACASFTSPQEGALLRDAMRSQSDARIRPQTRTDALSQTGAHIRSTGSDDVLSSTRSCDRI